MPITAKFSEAFSDRLGHDVADELVEWFNQVDVTYRSDFKDLFQVSMHGLDARLRQDLAETDARWEKRFAQMEARWDKRLGQLDARWEKRFLTLTAEMTQRFDALETRTDQLDAKIDRVAVDLRTELLGELRTGQAEIREQMTSFEARLLRQNVLLWLAMATVLAAVLQL